MFDRTFDEILQEIITDHVNQDPVIDISKGSPDYITSAAVASAIWGMEKRGKYLSTQIVPGPDMSRENLEHWAIMRGLALDPAESDAALLTRLLFDIRHPPAGGNKYDYSRWAKLASLDVAAAWCVSQGQGTGTVDVIILANAARTGSEIPANALLSTVRAFIADICPDQVQFLRVLAPEVLGEDVTISRAGTDYPDAQAIADITTSLAIYIPGQPLYQDTLKGLALGGGDGRALVTLPAADIVPTPYQMIRPGAINVT